MTLGGMKPFCYAFTKQSPHDNILYFILFWHSCILLYMFLNSSELKKLCETTTLNGALLDTGAGPYHGLQYIVLVLEGYITQKFTCTVLTSNGLQKIATFHCHAIIID